jgi:integrase/recombinase XerD
MQRPERTRPSLYGPDGRRKYLTPHERSCFIAAAVVHPRDEVGTFALMLAFTGCRISEVLALRAANIECIDAFASVRSLKKRGKLVVREIPLPPFLIERLRSVHRFDELEPDARLWSWTRGRAWSLIRGVMNVAGIAPGVHATAKGLRHGYAIHALRSGVPINLVKRWLGHASLVTTEIYLDVIGEEERMFAERMWIDAPRVVRAEP